MPHHGISYLVLFGGRDNDRTVSQIPRTFSTENVSFKIHHFHLSYSKFEISR
jgi:hypothetical protein